MHFGEVKRIRHQSFVSDANIFTGTRLVSIVLRSVTKTIRLEISGINIKQLNARLREGNHYKIYPHQLERLQRVEK